MTIELWTLAIALITAITCALCGVLLVVKREALVCEGLSHAVLPGIVVAFVLLRDRSSPLLIAGAAATGLVMVLLVQAIHRTRLVDRDASLGIVFAAMFSAGVLLATQQLRNTHFHASCIIDGNLALSPLDTLRIGAFDLGPKSFGIMLILLLAIAAFLYLFFKELQLMLFDETLARGFGFKPALLHALWLAVVSLTTVAAFETAGSVLVVALMITPPAAASLLTNKLPSMLVISGLFAAISAVAGFYLGLYLDISPTGPMSSASGLLFLVVLAFAPRRGLFSRWKRRLRARQTLQEHLLLLRLAQLNAHDSKCGASDSGLAGELCWPTKTLDRHLRRCQKTQLVAGPSSQLQLTAVGQRRLAELESELMRT